jgi:hypothetical protein
MVNELIVKRLAAIQSGLSALHAAGDPLSSASRGTEREHFINTFLREVFPLPYRFGSGDITDRSGRRSGQSDIVIEYPFLPSLPFFSGGPRLYLAEGVAAVIEVKSNICDQWNQVESSAVQLKQLKRSLENAAVQIGDLPEDVPLFAVGYRGWQSLEAVREHVIALDLDGILVVDPGLYVSNERFGTRLELRGPESLWGLVASVHHAMNCIRVMDANPSEYVL